MGEHVAHNSTGRLKNGENRPTKQSPEALGRRLLDILVYTKGCRIGGKLTIDDLTETENRRLDHATIPSGLCLGGCAGVARHPGDLLRLTTAGLRAT